MGGSLSLGHVTGLHSNQQRVSEHTKKCIRTVFEALTANPRNTAHRLEGLLQQIPKNENILCVLDNQGYNLLQICVGINNIDMIKWILSRHPDLNRGACSLPLHIACVRGLDEAVDILLKHGARTDVDGRMCWPGHHNPNCEQRSKQCYDDLLGDRDRSSDKLQNALCYAIDGDHPEILDMLSQREQPEPWLPSPWHNRRPLLSIACERGAWNCVQYLLSERADEINQCYDEYYPIHQAVLHDLKFVERLIQAGAIVTVRTATQNLTVLHVLFLLGKKSAEDTLQTTKLLLEHGLKELINEPDSLGNTPLHALIVRYAIEEKRLTSYQDYICWSKWDCLNLFRYLILQGGARQSINQPGNSAIACVLRQVRDWEFRYELLSMLLAEGGDPNLVGRDGSVPLMVCLVPLINKDLLHNFTHNMKVFYLNCVRILCKYNANPNCIGKGHLTPLHVLMFAAGEYITLAQSEEKDNSFAFIRQLLVVLLQHGLDVNIRFSSRTQHILLSVLEMVMSARNPSDLDYVYDLTLTLIQYGADPNVTIVENGICHSQSSLFLKKSSNNVLYYYIQWLYKKETLLLDAEKRFAKIIRLYAMCMDHKNLYQCLKLVYTQSEIVPVRTALCQIIREYSCGVRSLQHQCRIAIYKRLKRCPGSFASKLPLPPPLQRYLVSFE